MIKIHNFFKQIEPYKKQFLFWGIINLLITNIILQIFLVISSVQLATFLSQVFNIFFGYKIYSSKVLKIYKFNAKRLLMYILLAPVSWLINLNFINFLSTYGLSKNISAALIIPFLTIFSFLTQKFIIFRK